MDPDVKKVRISAVFVMYISALFSVNDIGNDIRNDSSTCETEREQRKKIAVPREQAAEAENTIDQWT